MKRPQRIILKLYFQKFIDSKIIIIFGYMEKNKDKNQPSKEKK